MGYFDNLPHFKVDQATFDKIKNASSCSSITENRIRGVWEFGGKLWVNSGGGMGDINLSGCVPADQWTERTYTYAEKSKMAYDSPGRIDFYRGILVRMRGKEYVLTQDDAILQVGEPDPVPEPSKQIIEVDCGRRDGWQRAEVISWGKRLICYRRLDNDRTGSVPTIGEGIVWRK